MCVQNKSREKQAFTVENCDIFSTIFKYTKRSKADDSESDGPCSAPDSHSFPRFIIIMPTGQKTISELSPFWIQKALQANIGTVTVKRGETDHRGDFDQT